MIRVSIRSYLARALSRVHDIVSLCQSDLYPSFLCHGRPDSHGHHSVAGLTDINRGFKMISVKESSNLLWYPTSLAVVHQAADTITENPSPLLACMAFVYNVHNHELTSASLLSRRSVLRTASARVIISRATRVAVVVAPFIHIAFVSHSMQLTTRQHHVVSTHHCCWSSDRNCHWLAGIRWRSSLESNSGFPTMANIMSDEGSKEALEPSYLRVGA